MKVKFTDIGRCLICLHNPCECKKEPVLTDEAFERTKGCREGHNCCHNNNFGGELCEDCHIDPDEDYV